MRKTNKMPEKGQLVLGRSVQKILTFFKYYQRKNTSTCLFWLSLKKNISPYMCECCINNKKIRKYQN